MKEKKKETFGDLKIEDSIYQLSGLEVKKLKIIKVISEKNSGYIYLYTGDKSYWYVGKSARNSYGNTIFVDADKAFDILKERAIKRFTELENKIDQEIQEYDRLEKFLCEYGIKGKTLR